MHCRQCLGGEHQLCPQAQPTIVGHRGGFATHVRSHWAWAVPVPEKLAYAEAGPLLCCPSVTNAPQRRHRQAVPPAAGAISRSRSPGSSGA